MTRRSARAVVCAATVVLVGCSSDPATEVVVDPKQDAAPADGGEDASEAGALDAALDGPMEAEGSEDAAVPSVSVALYPTPAETPDGGTDEGASTEAVLVALAAGAGGLVIDLDWERFPLEAEGSSDSWAHFGAMASHLREERKQLLFSVSVVNALADSRPAALQGQPWTAAAMGVAMRDAIDRVFETFGEELAYVSFGMEVDRYLAGHASQSSAFVSFLSETLDYARSHPSRPESTRVGLTWSAAAWSDEALDVPDRDTLAEASDAVMLAYYGLDGAQLLPPSEAVTALGAVVKAIVDRPVVLHRVAYTTSTLLGSSEAEQAAFVSGLLGMVREHRQQIPFVGVAMLHDPAPAACLKFAEARGASGSAELYAFWCSAGLRERQGKQKEGFSAFLSGASGLE